MSYASTKYALTFVSILTCILIELHDASETGQSASSSKYELHMIAAAVEYRNRTFLGPSTFVRVSRKTPQSVPTLNCFFQFLQDVPESMTFELIVLAKMNNQWKETFMKVQINACRSLESQLKYLKDFFASSNFPKHCPVNKGNYTVTDHIVDAKHLPAVFPNVVIRIRAVLAVGDTVMLSSWLDAKAESRKARQGKRGHH